MIKIPALTNAASRSGAAMGRADTHNPESQALAQASPVAFVLVRLAWVDGDYDAGGAYWGHVKGEHIYRAYSPYGIEDVIDLYRRAKSFQDAEAQVRKDYPKATFTYAEDETEERFWFTSSSGRVEFQLTLEQAESVSHSGQCDDDVAALMADPFIRLQLARITPDILRLELREYGAWEDAQLADHQTNLSRILWLAGGDIVEEQRAKSHLT
jgi:hypothetical protein